MILPRKTNEWYFSQIDRLKEVVSDFVACADDIDGFQSHMDKMFEDRDSLQGLSYNPWTWLKIWEKSHQECKKIIEMQVDKIRVVLNSFENWNFQNTDAGLKSITIMGNNLITEKRKIIQKLSTDIKEMRDSWRGAPWNPIQEEIVEQLEWVKSMQKNQTGTLAKFLWNLTKDETWWQEKNKEQESKDDLKQSFAVLDSKETDSSEKIKAKFRELIQFYHPDNYQNSPEKIAFAEKKTKELNKAFDKLHEHGIL